MQSCLSNKWDFIQTKSNSNFIVTSWEKDELDPFDWPKMTSYNRVLKGKKKLFGP